jgi:thiol-disulfide isomerase/thioredoxin
MGFSFHKWTERRFGGYRAAVLVCLAAACGAPQSPAPEQAAEPTAHTAGVSVVGVDRVAALLAGARGAGQVTVVNLWATWCPPCVAEMPEFAEFFEARDPKRVLLLSLSYDDPEKVDIVREFHESKQLPFDVYVLGEMDAPEDIDGALGTEFGGVLPTTLVFDTRGRLVHTWEEAITRDTLEAAVKKLL